MESSSTSIPRSRLTSFLETSFTFVAPSSGTINKVALEEEDEEDSVEVVEEEGEASPEEGEVSPVK
jgi:hypothetical protein